MGSSEAVRSVGRNVILFLTPGCFDKGGISRYNRYQITALRDLYGQYAVQVHSVLGPRPGDFEAPFQVDWHAGGTGAGQKARYVARSLAWALHRRPRLVVAAHVNLSALAIAAARLAGGRSLLNVYGLEVWSGLRPDAAWGLRSADLVLADCHFTRRYVLENGLRPASRRVGVLWDCVDTVRFKPGPASPEVRARYGLPQAGAGALVLTLGRMTRGADHKGYRRLLEVFGQVAQRRPELRLAYAGKGELVEELRQRAAALGLSERVIFTGPVHEDDLPDVFRACDIFSLVSDRGPGRGEGIPLTPLEAASCGKPIMVGNQDGSIEAADDMVEGCVLDPFDAKTHAERLAWLAGDEAARRRMGEAARQRMLRHHDFGVFRARQGEYLAGLGLAAGTVTPEREQGT